MKKCFRKILLATLLAAVPLSAASAASQGTLGATSTGSASISVTKAVQAQISDISDMTWPNWNVGDAAIQMTSNVCVYSSTGGYKVTATGSGVANAFTISSGGNSIIYSVVWNSGGAGSLGNTGTALLTGIQSTGFSNASTTSATCNGGGANNNTARVIVNITQLAMEAAASSNTPYTGTLTMIVAPN